MLEGNGDVVLQQDLMKAIKLGKVYHLVYTTKQMRYCNILGQNYMNFLFQERKKLKILLQQLKNCKNLMENQNE